MTQFLSETEIDKTLMGVVIPSRPQILIKLGAELSKDDPDHLNEEDALAYSNFDWERVGDQVLEHLDLSKGDCFALSDQLTHLSA